MFICYVGYSDTGSSETIENVGVYLTLEEVKNAFDRYRKDRVNIDCTNKMLRTTYTNSTISPPSDYPYTNEIPLKWVGKTTISEATSGDASEWTYELLPVFFYEEVSLTI